MTKHVKLTVHANRGYAPDQVSDSSISLGELLHNVQEAIARYGEDAIVVTYDDENRYGASFGILPSTEGLFDSDEPVCSYCEGDEGDDNVEDTRKYGLICETCFDTLESQEG